MIALGASIGFFSGDPLRLLEDAQILKPNYFPSVPRVLNRIYQAAMVAGDIPGIKGAIFRRAVRTKLDNLYSTGAVTHPLWDRLVFRKVERLSVPVRHVFITSLDSGCPRRQREVGGLRLCSYQRRSTRLSQDCPRLRHN